MNGNTYLSYDYQRLQPGELLTARKTNYYPDFLCFDIETTSTEANNQKFAFVYLWQLNIFGDVVTGRTLDSFQAALDAILSRINGQLVIYVHNLSYEIQFLKSRFDFDSVLAVSNRKVITATSGRIEWRCSLRLSNMSLANFSRIWGGGEVKEDAIDYTVYRSSTEDLEPDVIRYGVQDVVAQRASILGLMASENDNVATVPLTATGYVRRKIRSNLGYWGLRDMQVPISPTLYQLLSEAFRGGNVHANRYYAKQILKNVRCYDEASAYPHAQCSGDYPVGEFKRSICTDIAGFEKRIERCCALIRMTAYGVELKNRYDGFPPMSVSKCWHKDAVALDNGRVLAAAAIGVTLTDVDYRIFMSHYKCKRIEVEVIYTARRGKLPKKLVDTIYGFYKRKTEYKNVEEKAVEYLRAKEDNNSVYGMSAQKPILGEYYLRDGILVYDIGLQDGETPEECYARRLREDADKRIMPYQYGVWVTANARFNLEIGLREDTAYCDTDATYSDRKNNIFTEYNAKLTDYYRQRDMIPYDVNGVPQVLGTYQSDPVKDFYTEFITLGAKKYAGIVDGKLKITVAGVPKKEGAKQLEKDGGLSKFMPGYTFNCPCNSKATYNDTMDMWYRGEHVTSNVHLENTVYKLGLSGDYDYLLRLLQKEGIGHVL